MRSAVFLDRDGVRLEPVMRDAAGAVARPGCASARLSVPYGPGEARILPGVREALAGLRAADYWLFVVTNQPEVARGTVSRWAVEEVHGHLLRELPWIDRIRVCYHDDGDGCGCRKPKPGLIADLAADFRVDMGGSFMVGDRWRDMEAGRNAGLRTVFVDLGLREGREVRFDARASCLADAARIILGPSLWRGEVRG